MLHGLVLGALVDVVVGVVRVVSPRTLDGTRGGTDARRESLAHPFLSQSVLHVTDNLGRGGETPPARREEPRASFRGGSFLTVGRLELNLGGPILAEDHAGLIRHALSELSHRALLNRLVRAPWEAALAVRWGGTRLVHRERGRGARGEDVTDAVRELDPAGG